MYSFKQLADECCQPPATFCLFVFVETSTERPGRVFATTHNTAVLLLTNELDLSGFNSLAIQTTSLNMAPTYLERDATEG